MNIFELAERRARAEQRLRTYARMNTPSNPVERVRSDALMQLATDALSKADAEYRKALESMSPDELDAAVKQSQAQ